MDREHVISDEVIPEIQSALQKNEQWLAYNDIPYFLRKEDIYFFKCQEEAYEFATNNISEYDLYNLLHFESVAEACQKISYGSQIEQQSFISSQKNHINMNEQNFDYLKNQLKYTGFGEDLQRVLGQKIQEQNPEFAIAHKTQFGSDQVESLLQFKKSEQNDMYFFNRYFLQIKNEKGEESFPQSFRVGKENNITLKEAYNLMNGRAVHKEMSPKEGEKYHAWLQLNFKETDEHGNFKMKQFHQNYGYNLEQSLGKYPVKELENPETAQSLIRSLERGNRQQVMMTLEGKEQKMFIEASPQFKSINLYDSDMKRVNMQQVSKKNGEGQSHGESKKQGEKPGTDEAGNQKQVNQKRNRRRQSLS